MIISRTQAEAASQELLIHALFLSGDMTEQHVNEAYRSRAIETHPDKGGSAEEFATVDRAKHILIHWLKRSVAVAATRMGNDCPHCMGTGSVKVQRGFRAMRMQCSSCCGTGDKDYERDKISE